MRYLIPVFVAVVMLAGAAGIAGAASQGFTIFNAIDQAVTTNPGVGEAAANRRATEAELRQNQSTLLPQVRVEGRYGAVKFDQQDALVPPQSNNRWLAGREASVFARQLVLDGFASINEIWPQAP